MPVRWIVSLGVLASALLNGAAIVLGRGSFVHWAAVIAIGIYVGVPALAVLACSCVVADRFAFARRLARASGLAAALAASSFVSLIPGAELARRDIAAAKNYCDSLIPLIDDYQRAHGVYPSNIVFVARNREVPRLLRGSPYYWSDGSEFAINFGDPRGLMRFIGYTSETRRWSEWH